MKDLLILINIVMILFTLFFQKVIAEKVNDDKNNNILPERSQNASNDIYEHYLSQDTIVSSKTIFWIYIFSKLSSNKYVIYDKNNPSNIIDIIGYKEANSTFRKYKGIIDTIRSSKSIGEIDSYYKNLIKIYGFIDIEKSYKIDISMFRGKSDTFEKASKKALQYEKEIKSILKKNKIPEELFSLIFIESMFNEKAISNKGAAGMWQLMPATANQYILVSDAIDERFDLIKATYAATNTLKDYKKILGTWPLAILAYHQGVGRIKRATELLGTKDISIIIENFKDPNFGFWGKNYYPEFLAANYVYNLYKMKGASDFNITLN